VKKSLVQTNRPWVRGGLFWDPRTFFDGSECGGGRGGSLGVQYDMSAY